MKWLPNSKSNDDGLTINPLTLPSDKVLDETDPPKIKRRIVSREPELTEPSPKEKASVVAAVLRSVKAEKRRKDWDFVD